MGGRRKLIDPQELKRLAGLGLTQYEMAQCLGFAETYFCKRLNDEPELREFIKQGRAEAAEKVAGVLFKKALEGNISACIWLEKTRFGRHERVEIAARDMSDDELMTRVLQIAKQAGKK